MLLSSLYILTRCESVMETAKIERSGFLPRPKREFMDSESFAPSKSTTGSPLIELAVILGRFGKSTWENSLRLALSFHFLTKFLFMVLESLASNHACRLTSLLGDQSGGVLA